jgi:hypothetical protein
MKPMPPPYWQLISERVYKTDLGDDKPEVLIILMGNEAFRKFSQTKKSAIAYIDGLHILKQKLNDIVFADVVPQQIDGGEWFVIVSHTTHSTAAIVAWQLPAPPPPPPKPKVPQSELRKPPSKRMPGAPKPEKL